MMNAEIASECTECAATARLAAERNDGLRCRCGAQWLPEDEREAPARAEARHIRTPVEIVSQELALLARWSSRFYGRAMSLEPAVGGDREAREDEKSGEFHRAATIHRRLESLRVGEGCTHYQILWRCHVEHETLKDLPWEVGWYFATPKRRAKWAQNENPAVAHAAIRRYGQKLHDAACAAYLGASGTLSS